MQTNWIKREQQHSANNYHPLPVVLTKGEGVWLTDIDGKPYLDMMSAYSAANFGHSHPRLVKALQNQAGLENHQRWCGLPQQSARPSARSSSMPCQLHRSLSLRP